MSLSLRVGLTLLTLFAVPSTRWAAGEIQSAARGDSPPPSVLREESQGYSFERPLIWRLEGFPGGFFIRSPEFGGAIIMGHQATAPAASGDLEVRIVAGLGSMLNVRDPVIVDRAAFAIGERTGVRLRYRSGTIGGGPADGVISGVILPNGRILVVQLRAIPGEKLPEYLPVYENLLTSIRFLESPGDEASQTRREIHDTFYFYKNRTISKSGDVAASMVSSSAIAEVARLEDLAIGAPEVVVRRLPTLDKLLVLAMRHRIEHERLKTMSAIGLFTYGISEGWVDTETVAVAEIGAISVDGDRARAEHFHAGQRVPYAVEFIRENDRWKVDLLPFMRYGGEALRAQIEKDGKPEDEVLLALLAKASRRKPAPTIWSPTE